MESFAAVPPWLSDLASWSGAILAVGAVVTLVARSVRKGVDTVKGEITHQLAPIMQEFGPNGGGMREAINKIDGKVDANGELVIHAVTRLDELDGVVKAHIASEESDLEEVKALLNEQVATLATKADLDDHLRSDDEHFDSVDVHLERQDSQLDAITSILGCDKKEKP